jgi:adenine-specific DNA-methyltransferase
VLWDALRNGRLEGRKFRRQQPIADFVVDFYCAEEVLAIEVDGSIHEERAVYDAERQRILKSSGLRIVRLTNEDVLLDVHIALRKITAAFRDGDPVTILPSPPDGEGPGVR